MVPPASGWRTDPGFLSVGLSLGSVEGHGRKDLDQPAQLCDRRASTPVYDHSPWSGSANNRYPDLLPLPHTQSARPLGARSVGHNQRDRPGPGRRRASRRPWLGGDCGNGRNPCAGRPAEQHL
ncbi:multinuclear nonheme iron-dependent oxidase [Sphingopyxis alaskensis]|uniref:multinuclear nonheme iron-dependent oxidase n=1 Tax=Sphingopyxis alaskensis TaxID=117207 RepID=UPI00129B1671